MLTPPVRFTRLVAVLVAMCAAAACSDRQDAARADSDLSHDLALAGETKAQPTLQDTAVTPPIAQPKRTEHRAQAPDRKSPKQAPAPQPTRVAEAPQQASAPTTPPTPPVQAASAAASVQAPATASAPAPAPVAKVIAAGSGVALTSGTKVCTATNRIGDKLTARVSSTVTGTGGAMIPAGTPVVLEVTQLRAGDSPDNSSILLRATSVYIDGVSYPVSGDVATTSSLATADAPSTGPSDRTKVVGGAVAGAILGQLLGHNTKGTVIGAAAGAATGAAVAKAQQNHQACLPEGAQLKLTLATPLTLN